VMKYDGDFVLALAAVSSSISVDVDVGSPTQTRNYVVYSRRQGLNAC